MNRFSRWFFLVWQKKRTAVRRAFTVIELLVVVAAITLVASAIVVSLSTTRTRSQDTRRVEDLHQLRTALELYYNTNLRYPAALTDLAPAYIPTVPRDPKGGSYAYAALGSGDTCGSYHLGATLDSGGSSALGTDSDQPAASTCTGSAADFSGKDVVACGGAGGTDRCYDIVPEILTLLEMGVPPPAPGAAPPPPGSQVAGASESFTFSGGSGTPVFRHADIQPRDVKVGDIQTVTAEVEDPDGVVELKTETVLDHSIQIKFMAPIEGAAAGCTSCKWRVTWEVNDTSNRTYHTIITAKNSKGETNFVTLAWTDPCSPSNGGDWTLDGNCTMTGVSGVDNGNFIGAAGYTMTIGAGATWAVNKGKTFDPGKASIALGSGATITFTNLWILDADADGYAPSATSQLAQDAQPTNYVRRNGITNTNDCYDSNSSATPVATAFSSTDRGDGSYDYNCDASQEKEYTATNTCP
ncbi:MAG: type II secretion system protein [bacterium]|nr:type II secretion system protein [bacterium]